MHAVARLALHPLIPNIQVSWVKLGDDAVGACLQAGANDLGGTLMNESITRAAGASHGQEMKPEILEGVIASCQRLPYQRNTFRVTWRAGCSNRPSAPTPRRSRRRTRFGEPGFRGSWMARSAIIARIRSPRFAFSRLRNPIGVSPPINRMRLGRRGAFGSTARTSATSTRHQPGPDAVSTTVPSMATDSDGRCTTAAAMPNCKASETAPARKANATDSARRPAGPGPIANPATSSVTPATAATSRPSQPRSATQSPKACENANTGSSRTRETRGPGPQP